jgi:biopolymer transport protein ExbD
MTCLLFFLLLAYKSQAAQQEKMDLQLPVTTSDKGYAETLKLTVSMNHMEIEGSHLMKMQEGKLPAAELDGTKILPLYNRLVRLREIRENSNDDAIVLLMADRRLNCDTVTKVLKTAAMAGFPKFHLAGVNE